MKNKNIAGGLSDFDIKLGNRIEPRDVKSTSVIEITYEVLSDYDDFNRVIKEYYKDGHCIGRYDPLSQFSSIIFEAWSTLISKDR